MMVSLSKMVNKLSKDITFLIGFFYCKLDVKTKEDLYNLINVFCHEVVFGKPTCNCVGKMCYNA